MRGTGLPLEYRILPESDLNGAGLLYFARYVAIANYGVRLFLAEQLARPVSSPLIECLSTEHLNIYYFQNADAFDSVRIFVTAWLDPAPPTPPALDASGCRSAARFRFDLDLYRASDGALMASCRLQKSLNVPDREKGLVDEAERLLAHLLQGEPEPAPPPQGAGEGLAAAASSCLRAFSTKPYPASPIAASFISTMMASAENTYSQFIPRWRPGDAGNPSGRSPPGGVRSLK